MSTTEGIAGATSVAAVDFLEVTGQAAIASARWLGVGNTVCFIDTVHLLSPAIIREIRL